MKQNDNLKKELTDLAKLQIDLTKKGGPPEDGQLFEQILSIQDEILKNFGLPTSSENEKLLWFDSLPTDLDADNRIEQLNKTATKYLSSNAKSDLQILRDAQNLSQDPFMVLPELKISTHSYTFFVYNEILLKRIDTVENILQGLRYVNRSGVLGIIGNLGQGSAENAVGVIQLLKENGVKYLDEFLSFSGNNGSNHSNQLVRFLNEINDKVSFPSLEERFNSLTSCLMNYLYLAVGKTAYRITECEIYYSDIDHSDPYVHGEFSQLTAGQLYFNKAGGLDITFGKANIPVFAGILIRGIRNLQTNEYTSKITEIVTAVFDSLGNIITGENGIYLRELMQGQVKIEEPIRTTRIGLSKIEADFDNFIEKPYRYIVELNLSHKFRGKEKVVKQLVSENKISSEEARNVLGYNAKF